MSLRFVLMRVHSFPTGIWWTKRCRKPASRCGRLERLPGAAIRYVLQDDRVHMQTIGMRYPAELDANLKVFAGNTTYTNDDRALLADVSAAVLNDENVRKMSVE